MVGVWYSGRFSMWVVPILIACGWNLWEWYPCYHHSSISTLAVRYIGSYLFIYKGYAESREEYLIFWFWREQFSVAVLSMVFAGSGGDNGYLFIACMFLQGKIFLCDNAWWICCFQVWIPSLGAGLWCAVVEAITGLVSQKNLELLYFSQFFHILYRLLYFSQFFKLVYYVLITFQKNRPKKV